MPKRFVLFDNDGVLVDTERWHFRAGVRALAEIGYPLDEGQYLGDMGQGLGTWAQARAAGATETDLVRARAARDRYYQDCLRTEDIEIAGVTEVLTQLAQHARLAIVTTAKRADFEVIHAGRRMVSLMDFVLVREDYVRAKPDSEPYLTALARFGADRRDTVVVEDSARGLASAVAAGIECAVVHNAFTASQDLSRATWRIDSLAGLLDIVQR